MPKAAQTITTDSCQCLKCQIVGVILDQQRVQEKGAFNTAETLRAMASALAYLTVEIQKAIPLSDPIGEVYGLATADVERRMDRSRTGRRANVQHTVH